MYPQTLAYSVRGAEELSGQWFMKARSGEPAKMPRAYVFAAETIGPGYRETRDAYDWVPVIVLHETYIRAWWDKASNAPEADRPEKLDIRQFAIAMRLHFPNCDPCRRNRKGTKTRAAGLAGLTGPGAERSPDEGEAYTHRRTRNGR